MSTETASTPANAGLSSRKKRLRLFVAAGGLAAALILGGSLWFDGAFSMHKDRGRQAVSSSKPIFIETPEMVTNLDAGPHRLSFVKVQCKIEVAQASDAAALSASMPRVVDMIQTYLRETRPEELRSDAGTYRLKEALLLRASIATSTAHVKDVLFEELIVQ